MAKALVVSAASFLVILPLDKIEDSLGPRCCQPDTVCLSCVRLSKDMMLWMQCHM